MDRKLLFFDIDGTLLAGGIHGYIPGSAIEALKQAQANGHLLFINSGRTRSFLPQQVLDFPFDGYVCGCGTEILLHDEVIFHNDLPKDIRFGIKDILQQTKIQGAFEGRRACFYDSSNPDMFPAISRIRDVLIETGGTEVVRTFEDPELDFDKFVIFADENSDLPLFHQLTEDHFTFIEREAHPPYQFAEIVPKNCSKATGIDFIADYLGLSLDDCFVFGDSTNDLSMLTHVKNSIAMGNSYPEVFGKTSYVTTPIDRDGIMVAMKHFGLI